MVYTESIQSNTDLQRIYTEQIWVYTDSTQNNVDLHRVYTEQYTANAAVVTFLVFSHEQF